MVWQIPKIAVGNCWLTIFITVRSVWRGELSSHDILGGGLNLLYIYIYIHTHIHKYIHTDTNKYNYLHLHICVYIWGNTTWHPGPAWTSTMPRRNSVSLTLSSSLTYLPTLLPLLSVPQVYHLVLNYLDVLWCQNIFLYL